MTDELQQHAGAEAGDLGGEAGEVGAESGNQDAGEGVEGDAKNQEGDEGSGKTDKEPTELEKLQAQVTELTSKNSDMATKMGRQSKEVGLKRQVENALRTDPEAAIRTMIKEYGVADKFGAGKSGVDLAKQFGEGTADDQAAGIQGKVDEMIDHALETRVMPRLNAMQEIDHANEFKDWDDLSDTRQTLHLARQTGTMSEGQYSQHAARGFHMADALTAAKEEGRAELRAELARKNSEQITTNKDEAGSGKGDENYTFANVCKQLQNY